MCTVVYIPGNGKQYFASLRDESPGRPKAIAPEKYTENDVSYLSPVDSQAGGSWIGVNTYGILIILLNGGFENHEKKKFYRKSRGLIVTELLLSAMPVIEWSLMNLDGIEPFTLIVAADKNLFRLVWDGEQKQRINLDTDRPHIFSSSTLYTAQARAYRQDLFENWIAMYPPVTKLSLLNFFNTSTDKQNGFLIDRDGKTKTLSYTFLEIDPQVSAVMDYYNLLNYTHTSESIGLEQKPAACILPDEIQTKYES
jgi:hypothetical protein